MHRLSLLALLLLLLSLGGVAVASAQAQTCSALVQEAIEIANANCDGLARNEVCYGYRSISASFYQDVDADTFSEPTDIVGLTDIRRLETLPIDPDTQQMGVALMRLQAMLPNTLPGQSVLFIMIGDVQVESAVPPTDAAAPADPVDVTVGAEADLRTGAATTYNSVATVDVGTVLPADGTSADSEWVRVIVDEFPLWVRQDALEAAPELDDLPTVDGTSYGAMQAFTLTSGIGAPACQDAPAALVVQGPQTAEVTLNINGVDVAVGSTVVFQAQSEDELRLAVIDGSARLNDDQIVLGGFKARIERPLASAEGTDGEAVQDAPPLSQQDWQPTEPLEAVDIERIAPLERLNPGILNYEVQAPRLAAIQEQVEAGALDVQNNFRGRSADTLLNYEANVRQGLQDRERPGIIVPRGDRNGIRPGIIVPRDNNGERPLDPEGSAPTSGLNFGEIIAPALQPEPDGSSPLEEAAGVRPPADNNNPAEPQNPDDDRAGGTASGNGSTTGAPPPDTQPDQPDAPASAPPPDNGDRTTGAPPPPDGNGHPANDTTSPPNEAPTSSDGEDGGNDGDRGNDGDGGNQGNAGDNTAAAPSDSSGDNSSPPDGGGSSGGGSPPR